MPKIRPLELFLIEFIIYTGLWLYNDYIATLVTLIFSSILFFILIISFIAEWIEPSKVPKSYFTFMIISILAPLLAAGIFVSIYGADLDWLKG